MDELVGCEAAQGLEPAGMVIGVHEQLQMGAELLMAVIVVAFDYRVLDRAVHSLDLTIRPRMVHLRQPVLNAVLVADPIKDVLAVPDVSAARGELNAIICEHGMNAVGHGLD